MNNNFEKLITDFLKNESLENKNVRDPLGRKNSSGENIKCRLINNKKKDKYIHTYDPTKYFEFAKNNLKLTDEELSIFDNEISNNCCNVVSVNLY